MRGFSSQKQQKGVYPELSDTIKRAADDESYQRALKRAADDAAYQSAMRRAAEVWPLSDGLEGAQDGRRLRA